MLLFNCECFFFLNYNFHCMYKVIYMDGFLRVFPLNSFSQEASNTVGNNLGLHKGPVGKVLLLSLQRESLIKQTTQWKKRGDP